MYKRSLGPFVRGVAVLLVFVGVGVAVPGAASADGEASSAEVSPAADAELTALLRGFREMPGLEASFEEEKTLALLAAPLRSTGTLYYAPGGYLLRRVETPRRAEIVVTPRELRVVEGAETQRFDLRAREDVAHFVQSFLWILSGDEAALRRNFSLAYSPRDDAGAWSLALRPRDERMAYIVREIVVRGEGAAVLEVEVREASGDTTLTKMGETNPERRFGEDELRTLFGVSAP